MTILNKLTDILSIFSRKPKPLRCREGLEVDPPDDNLSDEGVEDDDSVSGIPPPKALTQRKIRDTAGRAIFLGDIEVLATDQECERWEGTMYPPPGVNNTFNAVLCRLSTKESPIQGKGSFVAKGGICKHEVLGYYEGVLTTEEGPYVMELTLCGRKVLIDADPKVIGYESILAP